MLYDVYIFSTRFFYGRNWWCSMSIITFITPLKMILKSQVVDLQYDWEGLRHPLS